MHCTRYYTALHCTSHVVRRVVCVLMTSSIIIRMKHPRQRTYPTWITLLGPRGLLSVKGLLCVVYGVGTYSQILVRQLSILLAWSKIGVRDMKLKKTPRNGLKSCKPCDYSYVYFEFSLICLNFESRHWVRRVLSGRGGFARVGLE